MLYSSVAGAIGFVFLIIIYQTFFTAAPTCFDGRQNGTEAGVDCGGVCSLLCQATTHDPVVQWARSFNVGSSPDQGNFYTAAAYVQNNNPGATARHVKYSFQLFDERNILVIERDGVVDLPPVQIIPIIDANLTVGNRVVARTLFAFTDTPPAIWQKASTNQFTALHVTQQNLSSDASRLSAIIANNSLDDAKNVTATAILFDTEGIARAASKSVLGTIPAKSQQQIVFTWPSGIPNIVRAEITVLPSF